MQKVFPIKIWLVDQTGFFFFFTLEWQQLNLNGINIFSKYGFAFPACRAYLCSRSKRLHSVRSTDTESYRLWNGYMTRQSTGAIAYCAF